MAVRTAYLVVGSVASLTPADLARLPAYATRKAAISHCYEHGLDPDTAIVTIKVRQAADDR